MLREDILGIAAGPLLWLEIFARVVTAEKQRTPTHPRMRAMNENGLERGEG